MLSRGKFALLGALLLFCGCTGGSTGGRFPVSGKVTVAGQPLKSGTIEFSTEGGERGGASIMDGAYSVPGTSGLMPGTYTVRVTSVSSSTPAPEMPGESKAIEKNNKETIPAEFNTKSKLTYEAGSGKPKTFDVAIP